MKGWELGLGAMLVGFLLIGAVVFVPDDGGKEQEFAPVDLEPELGFSGEFPEKFTCDGEDVSPPISFGNVSGKVESIALILEDRDSPTRVFDHWLAWNITSDLPEALPKKGRLDSGVVQGENDFQDIGYGGPCPPTGTHTYRFTFYALDSQLELEPGSSKSQLVSALEGKVLDEKTIERDYAR